MPVDRRCEEVDALIPEVALGIASGEERGAVLHHVDSCATCRRRLDELSQVADGLLVLAPSAEPPEGFETRVAEVLARARSPRRPAPVRLVAAALSGALLVGAGAYFVTRSDRELARNYRAELNIADGKYFDVAPLEGTDGDLGHVFAYEGTPSWIMVVLDEDIGTFELELLTQTGDTIDLGRFGPDPRKFSPSLAQQAWGTQIPVPVHDLESITVENENVVLVAYFD